MEIQAYKTKTEMSEQAAATAAGLLQSLLATQRNVVLVAATGASQLEFLNVLLEKYEIDWKRVELFHLDEYEGVSISHPASFAGYMRDRLIKPAGIQTYHLLDGSSDVESVIASANKAIEAKTIDLAFVGIGENSHLAFNDPPANFETEEPYLLVDLDEACRLQQVGEGWFATLEDVPKRAISMSIHQILKAREILCIVPDERKRKAVKSTVEGAITPHVPASALQRHPKVTMFLDQESASLLDHSTLSSTR